MSRMKKVIIKLSEIQIWRSNEECKRKSFRARHNCAVQTKYKARYWVVIMESSKVITNETYKEFKEAVSMDNRLCGKIKEKTGKMIRMGSNERGKGSGTMVMRFKNEEKDDKCFLIVFVVEAMQVKQMQY